MNDRPTARDIRRLLPRVRQLLKADGFEARSFGNLELKSVISEVFDGVSNDDDNSRAAYRKLRRTGKGRLRKIDAEALQAPMNPDLLGPRHALAWATLDAQANPELFQAVRAVRQRFWEVSEAPFPAFPGGREQAEDQAAQWLETQRQYASPFQRGELRIACSAGDWGAANFAFNEVINAFSDDPDWKEAGQPIVPLLMSLSERLARENVKVEVFRGFPGEGIIKGEFNSGVAPA
ncbi:hypothetical protein SAMN04488058_103246 [Deinococcus reticulitermitis]|uniref:Uncharacterized protein n=1 Tax=Deinococcus reticulitermitis TaxID=856736 RepID=A0A1H6W2L5_9DEIO|nr:hypothetical protein [Deinococcus reticulitermitis]SEJ06515.1 hypothetical protein SAMN04488058_103246 [Deinococcus reticulitermitis]